MKTTKKIEVRDRLNLIPAAGDVASPQDGDIWYNDTTDKFRKRENGVTSDLANSGAAPLLPETGTGTATGSIVGELDGNPVELQSNGVMFFQVNPTAGSESVNLVAFNPTDDNNSGYFSGNTTNTTAGANMVADFNDGVKRASIVATADATESKLTHTADTHEFVGRVKIPRLLVKTSMIARNNFWSSSY